MAAPLFCPDEEFLRKRLKLSTVSEASVDTDATIDQAVLQVRTDMYRSLGSQQIDSINQTTFTETPTTDAEVVKAIAASAEISWCRIYLLRTLSPRFLESSAGSRYEWNEAPLLRQQDGFDVAEEIKRLEIDVQSALDILRGDVDLGEDRRGGGARLVEPKTTPRKPGRSIWPPSYFNG